MGGGGRGWGGSRLDCQKTALTTLFAFYAPKFGKVEGAYCFWLVRPSVRPLHFFLRYSFEFSYLDSSSKKITRISLSLDYLPLWSYAPLKGS